MKKKRKAEWLSRKKNFKYLKRKRKYYHTLNLSVTMDNFLPVAVVSAPNENTRQLVRDAKVCNHSNYPKLWSKKRKRMNFKNYNAINFTNSRIKINLD